MRLCWQSSTHASRPLPPAVSTAEQVAAGLTVAAKSAIFLSIALILLVFNNPVVVAMSMALRISAELVLSISSFTLHGE